MKKIIYPNVIVHQYESSISFKHSNKEDEVNLDQQTLTSFIFFKYNLYKIYLQNLDFSFFICRIFNLHSKTS